MLSPGFLSLARELIAANTVSATGTRQAADLLQPLWEHAGLRVRRQVADEVHVNVLGGPGGGTSGPGGVLLVTHLDTCARVGTSARLFKVLVPPTVDSTELAASVSRRRWSVAPSALSFCAERADLRFERAALRFLLADAAEQVGFVLVREP